jgi:hypothetical protein
MYTLIPHNFICWNIRVTNFFGGKTNLARLTFEPCSALSILEEMIQGNHPPAVARRR